MSNLLGVCPLKKKNCPYNDSYCFDCIKYEKGKRASTRPSEKQSRIVRLVGNQGKMTIDLDKKPIG